MKRVLLTVKRIKKALKTGLCFVLCVCFVQGIAPVSLAILKGDTDGDGKITAADARTVLRASVGLIELTEELIKNADTDYNGKITAADARKILRLSVGIEDKDIKPDIPGAVLKGQTKNGYSIYEANGMTYIDGILIANKTYSLPSDFNPAKLSDECLEAFSNMQRDAKRLRLNIYISSGFRSYSLQNSIYSRYCAEDGKALADRYSARPGHSEHQTGLAIDLNTISQSFANTAAGHWIASHCHEYGFILRYPEGKEHITGYMYEPWHIRYVGVEAACKIAESGLCLEEYYGITSSYTN